MSALKPKKAMPPVSTLSDFELMYHILNFPMSSPKWPSRMAALLKEKKRRNLP